jgi:uncharacterized damage-inducible protein DinB
VRVSEVGILFEYVFWIRDRVLEAAERVPPDSFSSDDVPTTRGLRATLVHELDVEWSWRERLETGAFPAAEDLAPASYADVLGLADHWRRDEEAMRTWLRGLTEEELSRPAPEKGRSLPLWFFVMHLVSHAIQQFSDAAVLLTRAGASPGDIGFLEFANDRLHEGAEG